MMEWKYFCSSVQLKSALFVCMYRYYAYRALSAPKTDNTYLVQYGIYIGMQMYAGGQASGTLPVSLIS